MSSSARLRIAAVQLSPVFKDVTASIARADALLATIEEEVDMIVLPEMALSGYCFTSRADVEPFLEDAATGVSFQWASATAKRTNAYVMIGFPERSPSSTDTNAYNSLLIVSPLGALVHVYRKHHLYTTDESWATAGPSFSSVDLPFRQTGEDVVVRIAPCICMDLNPDPEQGEGVRWELGEFAESSGAQLVICCMAWLDSDDGEEEGTDDGEEGNAVVQTDDRTEWERVRSTLGYWAARVSPLIGTGAIFVACNRVGQEGESKFTGSSCAMRLVDPPEVLEHATKQHEEVLMIEVEVSKRGSTTVA